MRPIIKSYIAKGCVGLLIVNLSWGSYAFEEGRDHAPLAAGHHQEMNEHLRSELMEGNAYSERKISAFIAKLQEKKESTRRFVFETQVLEKLELDVKTYDKASAKAQGDFDTHTADFVRGYDEYLIPKLEALKTLLNSGAPQDRLQGLVDDFARAYLVYYLPNAMRTIAPFDIDLLYALKRVIVPMSFSKNDKKKLESNNLRANLEDQAAIADCLGYPSDAKHYFTEEELVKLKECRFDLSRLNPGISPLWHPLTAERRERIHDINPANFPTLSDRVTFRRIIYRGAGSPKMKVSFERDGVVHTLKLKTGREVHTDKAVGKLFELIGFNQDHMQYRDEVKVNLGKTSYPEFLALFANKYGISNIARFINAHGDENGEAWVLLKDVIFEGRPPEEDRLGPVDIGASDLQNRREFRSLLLPWAWVGISDTKLANFKLIFKKHEEGLEPLIRMHDTGIALGGQGYIRKPRDILSFANFYKVNEFPVSFLKVNKRNTRVLIYWNDFGNRKRNFSDATWDDLKWMTRQIAAIPSDDIERALRDSGMPPEVVDIYHKKLLLRRNELIKAFELTEAYPLTEVPALKGYNPAGLTIKNGKVTEKANPGQNTMVHLQETWLTLIPSLLTLDQEIKTWKDPATGVGLVSSLGGLQGLKQDLNLGELSSPIPSVKLPVGLGIQASISRAVKPNNVAMSSDAKARLYKIIDTVQLRVSADSPLLNSLIKKAPLITGSFKLKFYEKRFQHIHYKDSDTRAYTASFDLPRIIANLAKYSAYKMEPLEVVKVDSFLGVNFEADSGVDFGQGVVKSGVGGLAAAYRLDAAYVLRDEYAQIHFFAEKVQQKALGFLFDVGRVNLGVTSLPLLGVSAGNTAYNYAASDYVLALPSTNRDEASELVDIERRKLEHKQLKALLGDPKSPEAQLAFTKNYDLRSRVTSKQKSLGLLFAANYGRSDQRARTEVTLPGGDKRYFQYRESIRNSSLGIPNLSLDTWHSDILVASRKRSRIITEMDEDKPDNFLLVIRNEDFFRVRKAEELKAMLAGLNLRYSKSAETPFYDVNALPTEGEVEKYRKVYAMTRVFLHGKMLRRRIVAFDRDELRELLSLHFGNQTSIPNRRSLLTKLTDKAKVNEVLKILDTIRTEVERGGKKQQGGAGLAKLYEALVQRLETETYGIFFLREMLGEDSMFVMGDIDGIFHSYSTMQDMQQHQRHRFAGSSWGQYRNAPPLQRFMRYHRLVPPSVHISKLKSDREIFGRLETAVAPNLEFVFDHNSYF